MTTPPSTDAYLRRLTHVISMLTVILLGSVLSGFAFVVGSRIAGGPDEGFGLAAMFDFIIGFIFAIPLTLVLTIAWQRIRGTKGKVQLFIPLCLIPLLAFGAGLISPSIRDHRREQAIERRAEVDAWRTPSLIPAMETP